MAYQKKTPKQRKEEINRAMDTIASQVPLVFQSDHFRKYLDFASSFHTYSVNNQLLILRQRPNATLVAGYRLWQSKGRFVNKGEKGIRILAPSSFKVRKSVSKLNECGKPAVGADGQAQTEKKDFMVAIISFTLFVFTSCSSFTGGGFRCFVMPEYYPVAY